MKMLLTAISGSAFGARGICIAFSTMLCSGHVAVDLGGLADPEERQSMGWLEEREAAKQSRGSGAQIIGHRSRHPCRWAQLSVPASQKT